MSRTVRALERAGIDFALVAVMVSAVITQPLQSVETAHAIRAGELPGFQRLIVGNQCQHCLSQKTPVPTEQRLDRAAPVDLRLVDNGLRQSRDVPDLGFRERPVHDVTTAGRLRA